MRNIKFGAYCLGLVVMIFGLVAGLGAQTRVQVQPRDRGDRNLFVLDGRGAELGVRVSDLDVKSPTTGVRVDEVHGDSPAEKAGIKAGDIVVDYDGERVRSTRQFSRLVQETPEGRSVAIGLMRDGKKETVNATPEAGRMTWNFGPEVDRALREAERGFRFELPREFNFRYDDRDRRGEPRRFEYRRPEELMPYMNRSRGRLGVQVQPLTDDLEEYFGVKNGGVLVSSVTRDSAASRAGIKAGDVIVSINGKPVSDTGALMDALDDISGEASIGVVRDKKEMVLKATITARSGVL
jgi:serine protease Do